MTLQIRSIVAKAKTTHPATGLRQWVVTSAAYDMAAEPSLRYVLGTFGTADSFPEAHQLAAVQRRDLDAELMEGVHASRATRRAAATA